MNINQLQKTYIIAQAGFLFGRKDHFAMVA